MQTTRKPDPMAAEHAARIADVFAELAKLDNFDLLIPAEVLVGLVKTSCGLPTTTEDREALADYWVSFFTAIEDLKTIDAQTSDLLQDLIPCPYCTPAAGVSCNHPEVTTF
jgi:hypothetical protein